MSVSWRDAYVAVAGRVAEQAPKARLIFTGASACVDAIFHIDARRMERLARLPDGRVGGELLARVMARIVNSRGGELLTRWPEGPSWVFELLGPPDRYQVGGTGP